MPDYFSRCQGMWNVISQFHEATQDHGCEGSPMVRGTEVKNAGSTDKFVLFVSGQSLRQFGR